MRRKSRVDSYLPRSELKVTDTQMEPAQQKRVYTVERRGECVVIWARFRDRSSPALAMLT
jgi:hypothetical protein